VLSCANLECQPPAYCVESSSGPKCVKDAPEPLCLPDQATWIFAGTSGDQASTVQAALDVYRTEHPGAFTDDGARLARQSPAGVDDLYDGLGVVLARSGLCGGQIRNDGQRGDKLGVLRTDGKVEVFHLVEYGGFRLQSPIRTDSVWRAPAAAALLCPPPVPERLYPDGSPHWFMRCKQHIPAGVIDCTPKVQGQPDYCQAVWGVPNLNCDIRPEGSFEREPCEATLYGSTRVESNGAAVCEPYGDNPMQFRTSMEGRCRLCATLASDPTVCSEWF
jgi:hypothetical protein